MVDITRRNLLHGLGAAALGATLPSVGRALGEDDPYKLVIVDATGGWDISVALDPKPGIPTVDSPAGDIAWFQDLPVLVDPSRPTITAFFEQWASRTAIVNGLDVRSISHDACTQKVYTGQSTTTRPDFGAIAGHSLGRALPLPYLVLGDVAFSGPLGVSMGRLGIINQLSALVDDAQTLPQVASFDYDPVVPAAADEALARQFLERRAERQRATRGAVGANAARVDDFVDSLRRSDLVRAQAEDLGSFGLTASLEQQTEFAVRALSQDLSWVVNLGSRLPLDTHALNDYQSTFQEQLFASLAHLAQQLDATPGSGGSTLLDQTLVVVVSEMSRTPRLNAAGGKDHWPVTSVLMFGGPVTGGRAHGATNDLVEARAVDFTTGEVDPEGQILEPAGLLAGILEAVGADGSEYFGEVEPFIAPFV